MDPLWDQLIAATSQALELAQATLLRHDDTSQVSSITTARELHMEIEPVTAHEHHMDVESVVAGNGSQTGTQDSVEPVPPYDAYVSHGSDITVEITPGAPIRFELQVWAPKVQVFAAMLQQTLGLLDDANIADICDEIISQGPGSTMQEGMTIGAQLPLQPLNGISRARHQAVNALALLRALLLQRRLVHRLAVHVVGEDAAPGPPLHRALAEQLSQHITTPTMSDDLCLDNEWASQHTNSRLAQTWRELAEVLRAETQCLLELDHDQQSSDETSRLLRQVAKRCHELTSDIDATEGQLIRHYAQYLERMQEALAHINQTERILAYRKGSIIFMTQEHCRQSPQYGIKRLARNITCSLVQVQTRGRPIRCVLLFSEIDWISTDDAVPATSLGAGDFIVVNGNTYCLLAAPAWYERMLTTSNSCYHVALDLRKELPLQLRVGDVGSGSMKWAWLHDYAPAARMATSAAAWRDYEPQARWIESIFEEMDPLLDLGPALHGIYRGPHHHRFRCEGCLSDRPLTQLRPYMFCNLCYSLLQPLHRWHDSALFQQYGQPELRFTQATIREHHTACGLRLAMNWSGAAYIHEKWIVKFIRAAEHLRHRSDDTWVTAALGATPGTTALRQFVQQNIAHERACRVTAFTLLENDQDAMMLAGLDKHSATRLMTILTEAGMFPTVPQGGYFMMADWSGLSKYNQRRPLWHNIGYSMFDFKRYFLSLSNTIYLCSF